MCPAQTHQPDDNTDKARAPWADMIDWVQAWHAVIRDPDKQIPEPDVPPEGTPLPEHLHLHCPECDYNLTGLKEWRCPECGEQFNPYRAYTQEMLKTPEGFLRYRFDPRDIRNIFWIVVLIAGTIPAVALAIRAMTAGSDLYAIHCRQNFLEMVFLPLIGGTACLAGRDASTRAFLVLTALWFAAAWLAVLVLYLYL